MREPRRDLPERARELGIEVGAREAQDLDERLVERPALLVRAAGQERVEDVADGRDAARERDLLAPRGRPGSRVPSQRSWWVQRDDLGELEQRRGRARQDRGPDRRVRRMTRISSASSPPGLRRTPSGMPILPTSCRTAAWRASRPRASAQADARRERARTGGSCARCARRCRRRATRRRCASRCTTSSWVSRAPRCARARGLELGVVRRSTRRRSRRSASVAARAIVADGADRAARPAARRRRRRARGRTRAARRRA